MKKKGKISAIKREYTSSQLQTMQSELAKKGLSRTPGTGVFKYPYKEMDGKYRTGLDPDAKYISRIADPTQRELEKKRVAELRDKLSNLLAVDLSPTSKFWNYALSTSTSDSMHVQPAKLMDGDNYFDLSVPLQELTYAWLRVHPTIASSYDAWKRGEFPADTQFYVADEEIENAVMYEKKKEINKAIIAFTSMTPTKMRKVARLMGLPISDETKEEAVYNQVDTMLKQSELKTGKHQGLSPTKVFTMYAEMQDNLLHIKDLVKQAIAHNVYRVKPSGKVYEGDNEIAADEDALVKYLADDDSQSDLVILEKKLQGKRIAAL